jgi:ParB family chromosome partitioning protein
MAKKNLTDLLGQESAKSAALPKLYATGSESSLPLEQIADRPGADTRPLNQKHVEALADSIAVLGLIEPLAVDQGGRLLAGGHRKAAIVLLQTSNSDAFEQNFPGGKIPVRVMPFDAEQQPDLALQIEVAENEQRRDYTTAEVRGIVDRLQSAGYVRKQGTLRKGEKPLIPALAAVIGKSYRSAQRYLASAEEPIDTPVVQSSGNEKLERSLKILQRWQQQHSESPTAEEADLLKLLPNVEKAIVRVLESEKG